MNEEINYTKEYFNYLVLDSSMQEYESEISPLFERTGTAWIISHIENLLRENINTIKQLLSEMDDDELREKLNSVSEKMFLLSRMKDNAARKDAMDDYMEANPGSVNLLFAKSEYGNNMIEGNIEDIKKYNDGKYGDLIELLKRLDAGETSFNVEKQKMLSNNKNLKGIYELKAFQVRLIYMREKEYTVVIGAVIKKDDNGLYYQSSLLNMKSKSEYYRNMIRNGTLDFQKELEYSREYFNTLVSSVDMEK